MKFDNIQNLDVVATSEKATRETKPVNRPSPTFISEDVTHPLANIAPKPNKVPPKIVAKIEKFSYVTLGIFLMNTRKKNKRL